MALVADGLLPLLHHRVVMPAQVVAVVQGQLNWRAAFRTLAVAWAVEWHRVCSMLCSPGTYGLGAAGAAVGLVRPASMPRSPPVGFSKIPERFSYSCRAYAAKIRVRIRLLEHVLPAMFCFRPTV